MKETRVWISRDKTGGDAWLWSAYPQLTWAGYVGSSRMRCTMGVKPGRCEAFILRRVTKEMGVKR